MNMINELFKLKPGADETVRVNDGVMEGGRRSGENENPYLSARRTWNDHMREVIASRTMWQMLALLCLLIALAGVGGVIVNCSQCKFIPYILQVQKTRSSGERDSRVRLPRDTASRYRSDCAWPGESKYSSTS